MNDTTTSYSIVYARFFDKLEKDIDFFDYYNLTEEESLAIAKQRANNYLNEAVAYLLFKCTPDVDFTNRCNKQEVFNFALTNTEIELLSRIMYVIHLEREISRLKPVLNNLTASDIKALFSPANDRKTYQDMLTAYKERTDVLITNYAARYRLTGKLKPYNYNGNVTTADTSNYSKINAVTPCSKW